jgi:phospholipase C
MSFGKSDLTGTNLVIELSQHSLDDPPLPVGDEPDIPHWYEVRTLSVTLMHSNTTISTTNSIVNISNSPIDKALRMQTDSLWHDEHWRLRIQRNPGPSVRETREYRISVRYPSQLPIVERRIPLKFFQKGFEENWNKQQLINVQLRGSKIFLGFRQDFAELYHVSEMEFPIPKRIVFHDISTIAVNLGIGAGRRPSGPVGEGNSVFVSVRILLTGGRVTYTSKIGDIHGGIIPESTITVRFYLYQGDVNRSSLQFDPAIDADSLFKALVIGLPDVGHELKETVIDLLVEEGNKMLKSLNGSAHFGILDKWLKPWFVGGFYEAGNMPFRLLRMRYAKGSNDLADPNGLIEPATGNLVITTIGRREVTQQGTVLAPDDIDDIHVDDGSIPLFDNIGLEEQIHILPAIDSNGHEPIPIDPQMKWLNKIEHIVVLMQENRSFDQVLGYLRREKINEEINGLLPDDDPGHLQQVNKFQNREFRPKKAEVYSSNPGPTWTRPTAWPSYSLHGPGHSADAVADQINGGEDGSPGAMKGFVSNFAKVIGSPNHFFLRQVMDYFNESDLPIYAELARQFGICDNWFCSFAGGTHPNRFVTLTGKLNRDRFGNIEEDNPNIQGGEFAPVNTPTLFDYLSLYEKTWRVYEHGFGFTRLFAKYTFDITNVLPFNDPELGFEAAARAGTLPNVTWIEPDYIELPPGNDDHAPADMLDGQLLVERIVKALVNSPNWNKTLLIITYDEHGGFYDHVTPPPNDPPLGDSRRTMGPRVPTFVISPLIEAGSVFHERFDHTSIGATILRRFCGRHHPKVSERLDHARDLRSVLGLRDTSVPRTDFGLFGSTRPIPELSTGTFGPNRIEIGSSNLQREPPNKKILLSLDSDLKKEDFHWFLRISSLFTGISGNPYSFNPNSLRGWLMLNGFDGNRGIRSIMSTLSVSTLRQLIKRN